MPLCLDEALKVALQRADKIEINQDILNSLHFYLLEWNLLKYQEIWVGGGVAFQRGSIMKCLRDVGYHQFENNSYEFSARLRPSRTPDTCMGVVWVSVAADVYSCTSWYGGCTFWRSNWFAPSKKPPFPVCMKFGICQISTDIGAENIWGGEEESVFSSITIFSWEFNLGPPAFKGLYYRAHPTPIKLTWVRDQQMFLNWLCPPCPHHI